jgi:hypothetical protein
VSHRGGNNHTMRRRAHRGRLQAGRRRVVSTVALRCKRQRMAAPAHLEWPARVIGPVQPAVRSGSSCPGSALRAPVLRLAVSLLTLWVVSRLSSTVLPGYSAAGHARCPTLPSRGRHKGYALAPPLMSNVGHHDRVRNVLVESEPSFHAEMRARRHSIEAQLASA